MCSAAYSSVFKKQNSPLLGIIKRYENANIYRFLKANHLRIKLGKRLKHLNILVR